MATFSSELFNNYVNQFSMESVFLRRPTRPYYTLLTRDFRLVFLPIDWFIATDGDDNQRYFFGFAPVQFDFLVVGCNQMGGNEFVADAGYAQQFLHNHLNALEKMLFDNTQAIELARELNFNEMLWRKQGNGLLYASAADVTLTEDPF